MLILANAVAPGMLDRYLAANAIEGQETEAPVAVDRKDNLHTSVAGLHREWGAFGHVARSRALLVSGSHARWAALAAMGVLGALLASAVLGYRR